MSSERTFVIGDIHGCVEEVERMLEAIAPGSSDTLCFLGDYIDRGPSSRQVVDCLLRAKEAGPRCIFLKGNHEDMFLSYLGLAGNYGEAFLANGGARTLASYGLSGMIGAEAALNLPPAHLEFFEGLQLQAQLGEFLCVHAGVHPQRPLDAQLDEDLLWIRDEFLFARHPFPLTVLFGHTPHREVLIDLPFKLGLDTGLVYGNKLSCLELASKELIQIKREESVVVRHDLAPYFAHAANVA